MKPQGRLLLGVNIDHAATLRQARGTRYPDPALIAVEAERAGADGITLHVREDRRHVNERDLERILELCHIPVNFEMALTEEMLRMAEKHKPPFVCLVPEKREERTTEGGLDVLKHFDRIQDMVSHLSSLSITTSLFIEPEIKQIEAAFETRCPFIELHTGHYAEAKTAKEEEAALLQIQKAVQKADALGLKVNAGHGLHYHNTSAIAKIPQIIELNIGHAIIAQALFEGMFSAVARMKTIMEKAR